MPDAITLKTRPAEGRLPWRRLAPRPYALMGEMETYFAACDLEPSLIELVKMRASQINGCAYCIDLHSKDARAAGESEQRLYALNAWRETALYSERERAALAWTESVTNITDGHAPDEAYDAVRRHFGEAELTQLTWVIAVINAWNRLAIGFRLPIDDRRSANSPADTFC